MFYEAHANNIEGQAFVDPDRIKVSIADYSTNYDISIMAYFDEMENQFYGYVKVSETFITGTGLSSKYHVNEEFKISAKTIEEAFWMAQATGQPLIAAYVEDQATEETNMPILTGRKHQEAKAAVEAKLANANIYAESVTINSKWAMAFVECISAEQLGRIIAFAHANHYEYTIEESTYSGQTGEAIEWDVFISFDAEQFLNIIR